MLIRSKILREGGTKVVLDGTEYHFKPTADAPDVHVCDVKNAAHRARLLSIKEGFCIHTQKTADQKAEAEVAAKELEESEAAEAGDDLDGMTRKQIDSVFADLFDRKPNSRATDDSVKAKIREKRAEVSEQKAKDEKPKAAPKSK